MRVSRDDWLALECVPAGALFFGFYRGSGLGLPPIPFGLRGVYGGFAPMPPNVDKNRLNVYFFCMSIGFFVPLQ